MPEDISREQVQRLQADGAALVEVLPREEYEREHLAGADVPTCRLGQRIGEIDADLCVVVNQDGVVLGDLRGKALEADPSALVDDVMNPAPATFRPYVSVHAMAHHMQKNDSRRVLVSDANGRLVGLLRREDVERALHASHTGGPVLASE